MCSGVSDYFRFDLKPGEKLFNFGKFSVSVLEKVDSVLVQFAVLFEITHS